jgi:hypothetical protein
MSLHSSLSIAFFGKGQRSDGSLEQLSSWGHGLVGGMVMAFFYVSLFVFMLSGQWLAFSLLLLGVPIGNIVAFRLKLTRRR